MSRALLVVALAIGASACGDDDLTPEEARRERVEERLKLSFTDEQVGCMLEQFSESVLISLDGEGRMPQGGDDLEEFTTVAQACVIESDDRPEGTPGPEATDPAQPEPPDGTDGDGSAPDATTAPNGGAGGGPETRPETEAPAGGDEADGSGGGEAGRDGATSGRAG